MKLRNPFRREVVVQTRASYSDSITELFLRQALGQDAVAEQTAAAEFVVGLVSRCLSVGQPEPAMPAITPGYLADLGRRLMVNGNAVAKMAVNSRGLTLMPASGFTIFGGPDPDTWHYMIELPGPTRRESETIPAGGVVHCRLNVGPTQGWLGISPLVHAGISSAALANVENRLKQEAGSRVGYLLPHRDLDSNQIATLKADLASMAGGVGLVHSQNTQFDSRGSAGGAADWSPRRFGMDYPENNTKIRRDLVMDCIGALGCPPALYAGDTGTAMQEAYRIFYASTLEPIATQAAAELGDKLDRPGLELRLDRVAGSDVMRRASAYAKLVETGYPSERAALIAGVR